ncbi:hypothetical protein GCM10010116_07280 [Microbispora rosea subsp. aerata]|nr:cupin domain-containing protein [Microbispora rosea]GGO03743.1 hypothetical protein GCM10010116_07280 [Microbispora rosea subsp. aerata]GIH54861.1 hypothetical protein Mro02_17750 [Microbispora rosea subsp. aerata]GLJ83665.1 hypothetical protein GCM10017588_23930 [Microbispora rosea subsp. aerata]
MMIRDIANLRFEPAYGVCYQHLYPHAGEEAADWGCGYAVLEANRQTVPHRHEENEAFVVLSGHGTMAVGEETARVTAPSMVLIPGDLTHWLRNDSDTEPLVFLSIYWPASFGAIDL